MPSRRPRLLSSNYRSSAVDAICWRPRLDYVLICHIHRFGLAGRLWVEGLGLPGDLFAREVHRWALHAAGGRRFLQDLMWLPSVLNSHRFYSAESQPKFALKVYYVHPGPLFALSGPGGYLGGDSRYPLFRVPGTCTSMKHVVVIVGGRCKSGEKFHPACIDEL